MRGLREIDMGVKRLDMRGLRDRHGVKRLDVGLRDRHEGVKRHRYVGLRD